jgi:hypothetical protein
MVSIRTMLIAGFLMIAMLAPLAQVQPTVLAVTSNRDASASAAASSDTQTSDENRKFAAERAPHKSKKKNFMHKMRDKASAQLQKLMGSNQDENRQP